MPTDSPIMASTGPADCSSSRSRADDSVCHTTKARQEVEKSDSGTRLDLTKCSTAGKASRKHCGAVGRCGEVREERASW